jgi:hypothetical protein
VSDSWESAYVAVSVLLGESVEATEASLALAQRARAEPLLAALRNQSRAGRAQALAEALSSIARALEATAVA